MGPGDPSGRVADQSRGTSSADPPRVTELTEISVTKEIRPTGEWGWEIHARHESEIRKDIP